MNDFKLINAGYFYADGGAMFGAVPKVTWSRSYPANERNLCVLAMHAGLVKTPDGRVILVDPGVSSDALHDAPAVYYQFHDMVDLYDALQREGVHPEEVTDVVFTHLHFDHCGAAVRKNTDETLTPAFPNATHWMSRVQYENERHPHPLEDGSYAPKNTEMLWKEGLVRFIEATTAPYESVRFDLYDGHTFGQIAATIKTDEATFVFPGDIIPLASHIVPERISAYDLASTLSYNSKLKILEKAVANAHRLVFYHDAYTPCATIRKTGASFKIEHKIDS